MRHQLGSFVLGFLACAVIVSTLGAQFGDQDDYQKACLGFMAEQSSASWAIGQRYDQSRQEACIRRRDYWFKQLEKFKP